MIHFLGAAISLFLTTFASFALPRKSTAQDKPLERRFVVAESASYRIQLKVRIETETQQTTTIGAKTYVQPATHRAEVHIAWVATRRILSIDAEGNAEVEETLSDVERTSPAASDTANSNALQQALRAATQLWPTATPQALRYRETRSGNLQGLTAAGVPQLDEAPPQLVSLWLLRALRPTCPLPAHPVRLGESWNEPRTVQLEHWADVRASETGIWLETPPSAVPALRLHTTQQIAGRVTTGPEMPPEGVARGTFHGESLATLSLEDGRLLSATRSASREITWLLAPVEGLPERPQFRGRLSVEVQIQSCDENTCPLSVRTPAALPR